MTRQRGQIFDQVGVLIYVFDVESREFDGLGGKNNQDLLTYHKIVRALEEKSPDAQVFTLVHKMDLVHAALRDDVVRDKGTAIKEQSAGFRDKVRTFGSSIWDQTLYQVWGIIVHGLVPNLDVIEGYLRSLVAATQAEEVVLFERVTFLTVTSVTTESGDRNPCKDRYERLSNIIKSFKNSLA